MPRINLIPEQPRPEPLPELPRQSPPEPCPGCLGQGRYVGFATIEDPCRYCGGTGRAQRHAGRR